MIKEIKEVIDTTVNHEYEFLNFEWFTIKNLEKIKAVIRKEGNSEGEKSIYLFGRHDDCFQKGAQIFVYLFNLPLEQNKYEKKMSFYEEQRSSFNLKPKQIFSDSILSLPSISLTP